jgi:transposase
LKSSVFGEKKPCVSKDIFCPPAVLSTTYHKPDAGNGPELRLCYEVGPCGHGIQRQLTMSEHDCIVVAPSLIPRRPGDQIKTDRGDVAKLPNCIGLVN